MEVVGRGPCRRSQLQGLDAGGRPEAEESGQEGECRSACNESLVPEALGQRQLG